MRFRSLPLVVFAVALGATVPACSDDPAVSPDTTAAAASRSATDATTDTAPPSTSGTAIASGTLPAPSSAIAVANLPDACTAPTVPMYPNPATERWVPSPESGDVVDDFARLVLGWPDVQVVDERTDGPVTVVRITSSSTDDPVDLEVLPDGDGRPARVCGARSVIGDEWAESVSIRGGAVVSGFEIWVDLDHDVRAAIHELLPDVVSAQLLVSHGPHVQQVAATDPEQGWTFQLDHPTAEPGWQLAFWRDADGAALAVVDNRLPAGDFAAG